jgi:hypothetical protein
MVQFASADLRLPNQFFTCPKQFHLWRNQAACIPHRPLIIVIGLHISLFGASLWFDRIGYFHSLRLDTADRGVFVFFSLDRFEVVGDRERRGVFIAHNRNRKRWMTRGNLV